MRQPLLDRRGFVIGSGAAALSAVPAYAQLSDGLQTLNNADTTPTVDARRTYATVPRLAFGLNLLATRDNIRGTYDDRALEMNPTMLRWPGGEISHHMWSPTGWMSRELLTTLWRYIRFCDTNNITPNIVFPGKLEFPTLRQQRVAARRVVQVVNAALTDRSTQILWELGNEPYADTTPAEYAEVVNMYISMLRYQRRDTNDMWGIMPGRPTSEISQFAEPLSQFVDPNDYHFITFHSYPANHLIYTLRHIETARQYLGGKPVYFSEWNHYACWNPELGFPGGNCPSVEDYYSRTYGMSLAGAMVSHFAQMMTFNVLGAAFWAVQQNNMTSMFPNEGLYPNQAPYVPGHVFRWLRETEGMRLVSIQQTASEDQPAHFAFASDNRMLIFVDARQAVGNYYIDVSNFEFSRYWGRRLSGPNDARNVIPVESGARAVRFGNRIRVPLRVNSSHELIKVDLRA